MRLFPSILFLWTLAAAQTVFGQSALSPIEVLDQNGNRWRSAHNGLVHRWGDQVSTYTTREGLASNQVNCLYLAKDGSLWVGTPRGASRFFPGATYFHSFTNLRALDVRAIDQDAFGTIWFGTNAGVVVYDGQEFQILGVKDGLPSLDVRNLKAYGQDRVAIHTSGGVFTYTIDKSHPPRVGIAKVTEGSPHDPNEPSPSGDMSFKASDMIRLNFLARDNRTAQPVIRYRLRRNETEFWSSWMRTKVGSVEIPSDYTSPGRYQVEAVAVDQDMNYSEPARMTLVVHPSSWRQSPQWIVPLLVAGCVALILGGRRYVTQNPSREGAMKKLLLIAVATVFAGHLFTVGLNFLGRNPGAHLWPFLDFSMFSRRVAYDATAQRHYIFGTRYDGERVLITLQDIGLSPTHKAIRRTVEKALAHGNHAAATTLMQKYNERRDIESERIWRVEIIRKRWKLTPEGFSLIQGETLNVYTDAV